MPRVPPAIASIIEDKRRSLTGDDWFTDERPYALELRGPSPYVSGGSAVFVLPLGPESYSVGTTMRASVTPTLGGIVAEERGVLWRQLSISGTFGLAPKPGYDTFSYPAPEGPMKGDVLSGPMWFKRLEKNVIGYYGRLKADQRIAEEVTLIWHDMRRDDHWIVVPEELTSSRSVQRRFQYPYTLSLKAIADADSAPPVVTSAQTALEFVKDNINEARDKVRQATALVQGAIDFGSEVLAEVRVYAADLDRVIDDMAAVVQSATNFTNGLTDTISIPRSFVLSTMSLLDDVLALLETATELPVDVRQNYQRAGDGMNKMAAGIATFGLNYDSEQAFQGTSEAGISGTSSAALTAASDAGSPTSISAMSDGATQSIDLDLLNAGIDFGGHDAGNYTGIEAYTIVEGDTIESLAATLLGDASLWTDLALVNGLAFPYITATGAPGTLGPGDSLMIPVNSASSAQIANAGGSDPVDVFGTNVALEELPTSAVGRPRVGWAIDKSTFKDIRKVSGDVNYTQALQMRMWTERGLIPIAPSYGLRRLVGFGIASADTTYLALAARETLLADSRTQEVLSVRLLVNGDIVDLDADILPVSETAARTIRTALT